MDTELLWALTGNTLFSSEGGGQKQDDCHPQAFKSWGPFEWTLLN